MNSNMPMKIPTPGSATPKVRILDGFRLEWVLDTGTLNTTVEVILRTLLPGTDSLGKSLVDCSVHLMKELE
jgi:hypothetical protein